MVRNTRHSRIGQELELGVFRKPIKIGEDTRNLQEIVWGLRNIDQVVL